MENTYQAGFTNGKESFHQMYVAASYDAAKKSAKQFAKKIGGKLVVLSVIR